MITADGEEKAYKVDFLCLRFGIEKTMKNFHPRHFAAILDESWDAETADVALQCAVFAESEVVGLVHKKTPKPDMARAVHDAIADRITSMVRRVGIEEKIALIGGVAKNIGFVKSLEEDLETTLLIPEEPEFVGALGAALVATDA